MDTASAAPASTSTTVDHDEDVYRASEEENAYTGTDEHTSMNPFIDDIDPRGHQFESDVEEFVDTDTDEDDSMKELEDEVNRLNELDDEMIYRIDQLIEDIDLRQRFEEERDRMRQFRSEEMDLIDQQIMMRDQFESDIEDFSDTDTDEDDSTGQLDEDMSHLAAKICKTKDLPISTPYVTLSHCWGKGVIFRLLQNNLQELSQAIPIRQLPKVFQDAIHVAHELGINYIWIDSLCIIQDSKEDWTDEAKKMGDVYLNGEFNIAATGYKDGLSGLFGERKAFSFVHIPMHLHCELFAEKLDSKGVFEGLYVSASHGEFSREVVYSPLNSRGWVAQERALSPAVIHYTPGKIYWECNESIASEAFLDGSRVWEQTEGAGRDRIRSLSTQSEREDVYSFWRTFLNRYAGMDMTVELDRLPAVAGIARILGELIKDNFVAGFWEGDLLRSLLMERHILVRKAIKREQLAPSWSWASMNADTSLSSKEVSQLEPLKGVSFRVLSDIPGFKSDLESPSFEKSGVRGLAIKGVLRKLPDDFDAHKEWVVTTYFTFDNKDLARLVRDKVPREQAWRLGDPTHMLLLARRYDTLAECVCVHGLLVQAAEPKESNTFRRSGTLELAFHMGQECDEYLGLREKDGGYEPSSYFSETGLQDLVLI
ncbi:hypothetical protein INS49_000063 [Diaporthe citri]|uniref:uncharacterized protein n=1 Tax=Diaporthe citri TaxID=83186 RepID=UPI001C7F0088|nr:uncharacterized protein INS49_000063 [Diaporthe citri]KAG6365887.1 hypothetical protein INS49_000063 [Diaporthe citri]